MSFDHSPHPDDQLPSESDPAAYLTAFLKNRDVPCPTCDYNLRDQKSVVCPECGNAIELWVRSPSLKYRWWIFGFAAACLGSPWIVLVMFLGMPGSLGGWEMFWATTSAMCMVLIFTLLILRKRFLRQSQLTQIGLAAIPVVSCVSNYAIFIWKLR